LFQEPIITVGDLFGKTSLFQPKLFATQLNNPQ